MRWLQFFVLSKDELSFPMYALTMCAGIFVALVIIKLLGGMKK